MGPRGSLCRPLPVMYLTTQPPGMDCGRAAEEER